MRTCKALYRVIRSGVCWVDHAASLPIEDLPEQYRGFLDDAACDSLGFESTCAFTHADRLPQCALTLRTVCFPPWIGSWYVGMRVAEERIWR